MQDPFESSVLEVARDTPPRRIGVRAALTGLMFIFPALFSMWLVAAVLLHSSPLVSNASAALHCLLSATITPLVLVGMLIWGVLEKSFA